MDLEREGRTTLEEGRAGGANSNLNYRGERLILVCGLWAKLKSKQALRGVSVCAESGQKPSSLPSRERSPFIIAGGKQSRLHTLARSPTVSCLQELTITSSHCCFRPCSVSLSGLSPPPFPCAFKDTVSQSLGTHLQDRDLYIQEAFHMPNHSNNIMLKYSYLGESKGL